MAHSCHAIGCAETVPPSLVMCRQHWSSVPRWLQTELWAHYRPGQERDLQPTTAYLRSAAACVRAVAEAEEISEAEITFEVSMYESWAAMIGSEDR